MARRGSRPASRHYRTGVRFRPDPKRAKYSPPGYQDTTDDRRAPSGAPPERGRGRWRHSSVGSAATQPPDACLAVFGPGPAIESSGDSEGRLRGRVRNRATTWPAERIGPTRTDADRRATAMLGATPQDVRRRGNRKAV